MMVAAVFISSLMNGVVAAASDASTEDEYVPPTFMAVSFPSTNMKHNAWHALCISLFDDDIFSL